MKTLKTATLIVTLLLSFSPLQIQAIERMFSRTSVENYCSHIRSITNPRSDTVAAIHELFLQAHESTGMTKKQFTHKYFFKIGCNNQDTFSYSADHDLDDIIALHEYGINLNRPFKYNDKNTLTIKDYAFYKFHNTSGRDKTKFRRIYKFLHKKGYKNCADQPELNCTATKYLMKQVRATNNAN